MALNMGEWDEGRLRQTSALNPLSDTLLPNRRLHKGWGSEKLAFCIFKPGNSRVCVYALHCMRSPHLYIHVLSIFDQPL